jgi:hypothetical protein
MVEPIEDPIRATERLIASIRHKRAKHEGTLAEIEAQEADIARRRSVETAAIAELHEREGTLMKWLEAASPKDPAPPRAPALGHADATGSGSRRWKKPRRLDDLRGRQAIAVEVFTKAAGGLTIRDFAAAFVPKVEAAGLGTFPVDHDRMLNLAWDTVMVLRANRDHLGVDFVETDGKWRMVPYRA